MLEIRFKTCEMKAAMQNFWSLIGTSNLPEICYSRVSIFETILKRMTKHIFFVSILQFYNISFAN